MAWGAAAGRLRIDQAQQAVRAQGECTDRPTVLAPKLPRFANRIDKSPTWMDEPQETSDEVCSELEALVSELDQLPVEPAENDVDEHGDAELNAEPEVVENIPSVSQEDHDAAIEALRQEHAQEIERLQHEHKDQVLQHLESLQNGLVEDVANRIEIELATTLAPLFQKDVARSSLEQLIAEIKRLIQSEAVERIQLSGPDTLVTAASMALAGANLKIDVETTDSPDLLVHLNHKILSTSIGDWSRKIEEALGA